jgi:hypothetical protein
METPQNGKGCTITNYGGAGLSCEPFPSAMAETRHLDWILARKCEDGGDWCGLATRGRRGTAVAIKNKHVNLWRAVTTKRSRLVVRDTNV